MTEKKRRHVNIPIFIPHLGCPNNCVFCNQRSISGHGDFRMSEVAGELERAFATLDPDADCEIAFFGGSFTGIDRGDMISLLELADTYVKSGRARSIRLSTRPDYIDGEILDILEKYSVRSIELGLQSLSPRVLAAAKRGHTAECAVAACEMIKSRGFELTGQMMIALPESMLADELDTAHEIARLCDSARIYPTVVFRGTQLHEMYLRGEYIPPSLDECLERAASALEIFVDAGKPVLRIGLHASESLSDPDEAVAGAIHPALGELVMGELAKKRLRERLRRLADANTRELTLGIQPSELSKAIGQKRCVIEALEQECGAKLRFVPDKQAESLFAPRTRG